MNSVCTFHAFVLAAFVVMLAPEADAAPPSFLRRVSIQEVQMDLQATLSTLLQDTSASATRRLQVIEASTWQTFQALPKNNVGRLAPPAVRYLVHGYFAKEHGWLIKGLEPHGMQLNITEMHDVNVLKDKAPLLVEGLLEARQADRGLSFNDIVTMVAVLEQMMFDDSMALLEAAYRLNGLSVQDEIDTALLHKVMQSYLVLFGQGSTADLYDVERHKKILESRKTEVQEFEHDTVLNYQFERRHTTNAFKPSLYSFKVAAEIMEVLAQNYGKWQNSECRDMKDHLTDLDPDGFGEVPLSRFYAQKPGSTYHFSESADYLRSTGALDETSPGNPKVYIANYIAGPSNCIATSSYYSVCCLSECAGILAELEHHIAAPLASPEKLLALIHLVSDTVLSHGLIEKLHAIATGILERCPCMVAFLPSGCTLPFRTSALIHLSSRVQPRSLRLNGSTGSPLPQQRSARNILPQYQQEHHRLPEPWTSMGVGVTTKSCPCSSRQAHRSSSLRQAHCVL